MDINRAQLKVLAVFGVFFFIGFGPVSPGCLIGMYSVIARPRWLLKLARDIYTRNDLRPTPTPPVRPEEALPTRKRCFLGLLSLFLLDIAPVPVTPTVAFCILLIRPAWFYRMVEAIYADRAA